MNRLVAPLLVGLLTGPMTATASVTMSDTFANTPNRTWIGRDWWANRLQDWAIEDGRLICLEARPVRPIRTAHWISRSLVEGHTGLRAEVTIELADKGTKAGPESLAGFLLGSGGPHVDHRLTAQTHHHPAEDGGVLAVVNGDGIVSIRRFDKMGKTPGSWSIGTRVSPSMIPLLEPQTQTGDGFSGEGPRAVQLVVSLRDGSLRVAAVDPSTSRELSFAEVRNLPARYQDGGIALVSHLGPTTRGRGYAFSDLRTVGDGIRAFDDRTFGPILGVMYTIDDGLLKMTAQLPPLGEDDTTTATLEIRENGVWREIATGEFEPDSATMAFRVEGWDASRSVPFRIVYLEHRLDDEDWPDRYQGILRADPGAGELVLAALNCQKVYTGDLKWNHDGLWMPHNETVMGVEARDPDIVFFAGDQIYEGDLTPVDGRSVEKSMLDYLYRWYRFVWSFRDLTRTRPSITIPDDHDVYHGNIWGAGGRKAVRTPQFTAQDSGGYKMPARFLNAVHRTQVSHLPDPVDPAPIEQGISVYFTDLDWGGVSFAILGDRMFKSSPSVMVPQGKFKNGWPQAEGFDAPTMADVEGAVLLGDRQEAFLDAWAVDYDENDFAKAVLSQTLFANLATLPQGASSGGVIPGLPVPEPGVYLKGYRVVSDGDSNGWPQTPRDRALKLMRRGGAVHICGDQHLGSTIRYGVDDHGDAGWAFCVPAISNTWPRRWFPPEPGRNRREGDPAYTGDFEDGWGNRITVRAVANPVQTGRTPSNLYDRMPGWGLIRFKPDTQEVVFECWPRWTKPGAEDDEQYPGWPVVFGMEASYGDAPLRVARIEVETPFNLGPLVRLTDGTTGDVHSVRRLGPTGGVVSAREPGPFLVESSNDGRAWRVLAESAPAQKNPEDAMTLQH